MQREKKGWWDFQSGPCSEAGWTSVCLWEVVSNFSSFTSVFLFLYLLSCLYLNPQAMSLFFFLFSPSVLLEEGIEQTALGMLVKSQPTIGPPLVPNMPQGVQDKDRFGWHVLEFIADRAVQLVLGRLVLAAAGPSIDIFAPLPAPLLACFLVVH